MKKFTLNLVIFLSLSISATSCVSKKKYIAAQGHIARLQSDSTICHSSLDSMTENYISTQAEYEDYKRMNENQRAALMAQLKEQGTQLSEKDQALAMRAERLRALQDRLDQQQQIVNNLRKTVADALVSFDSDDLSVEVRNGKVYVSLSDKLLFPSGSASLNNEGKDAIGKVAGVLEKNPKINIEVIGHTDSIPIKTNKYSDNWDLSVARATTITRLLTENYKIEGSRLTASGMGEFSPVAENKSAEGRSRNRRTEIVLTPKLEELFKIMGEEANNLN